MPQTKPDHHPENSPQGNNYEIHVRGNLIPVWEDWFEGFTVTVSENGEIVLFGPVADQAALHGHIETLRNLNMELISVIKVTKVSPL